MLRKLLDEFMDDPLSFVLFGFALFFNTLAVVVFFYDVWQEVTK